jgi:hypothetical protein
MKLLIIALDGKGAFGRFKRVLDSQAGSLATYSSSKHLSPNSLANLKKQKYRRYFQQLSRINNNILI